MVYMAHLPQTCLLVVRPDMACLRNCANNTVGLVSTDETFADANGPLGGSEI